MNINELESLAKQRKPLPPGMNLSEQHYFLALRSLCTDYFNQRISIEQITIEHKQLRSAFDRDEEDKKRTAGMYCQYQYNIKQAGQFITQLVKSYNAGESDRDMLKVAIRCVAALTDDRALENHFRKLLEESKCT